MIAGPTGTGSGSGGQSGHGSGYSTVTTSSGYAHHTTSGSGSVTTTACGAASSYTYGGHAGFSSGIPDTPSPSNAPFDPLEHLGANSPYFQGKSFRSCHLQIG
jgi:hypothetical protein